MEILSQKSIDLLKNGAIGVLPTDTLYGVVASAFDSVACERVYAVKHRSPEKPVIILLSGKEELEQFGIATSDVESTLLECVWPGKVSVIFPTPDRSFDHIGRGTGTLSFRVPDKVELRQYLKKTGPLVAPSANPEGETPAETIEEAREYFGDEVDFYEDGGALSGEPSTVVKIENGKFVVLRPGAVSFTAS